MNLLPDVLLYGGDYNPDQWLDMPDVLQRDIELMKKAHVNCVSLGIFAWSALEPEEGNYTLDWLEDIINNLHSAGVYVNLATPTGGMPHWLPQKYPEVMQTNRELVRNIPGKRQNFCYHSPIMHQKAKGINTALAKRFGKHPAVVMWHISNEFGNNAGDGACHCPLCQEAFRKWLREKYKTLDALNKAWWTSFWSHTYTDWQQIHGPVAQGETMTHGLTVDWLRFVSESMRDWCAFEVECVRPYSSLPATTNLMLEYKALSGHTLAQAMDVISWDAYPRWHQENPVDAAVRAAGWHSVMRSLKKQPFLLMESTPSLTNWLPKAVNKRPGLNFLTGIQALAHGSDSVMYFQWRKSRGACEKFHGAIVSHDNRDDTRVFMEAAQLGKALEQLSSHICGTCNKPRVAIMFDWSNWWAIEEAWGPMGSSKEIDYMQKIRTQYTAFWRLGIDVDFIAPEEDLSQYALVVAPMLYMITRAAEESICNFVAQGGTYIGTAWSNMVDDTDLCYLEALPLANVLGVRVEEADAPTLLTPNAFEYLGKSYDASILNEIVHLTTATALAEYSSDFYKGAPAITHNSFGKGTAYYLAAYSDASFYHDFYALLAQQLAIENKVCAGLPYGVTVAQRDGNEQIYFVQNFTDEPVALTLKSTFVDVLSQQDCQQVLNLPSYGVAVLKNQ